MLVAFNALYFRNPEKNKQTKSNQGDASFLSAKCVLQFRNIDEKWKSISSVIPSCRDHLIGDMLKVQSFLYFLAPTKKKSKWIKQNVQKKQKGGEGRGQKFKDTCFQYHYIQLNKKNAIFFPIQCQIHQPLNWRCTQLLSSVGFRTSLHITVIRVFFAMRYQQVLNRYHILRAFHFTQIMLDYRVLTD